MKHYNELRLVEGTLRELDKLTDLNVLYHATDTDEFFIYTGKDKVKVGASGDPIPGPKGDTGPRGVAGPASTVPGPKGDKGDTGPASTVPGPKGDTGAAGSNAVVTGYSGTFVTDTHTITVTNGLIKTVVLIAV